MSETHRPGCGTGFSAVADRVRKGCTLRTGMCRSGRNTQNLQNADARDAKWLNLEMEQILITKTSKPHDTCLLHRR